MTTSLWDDPAYCKHLEREWADNPAEGKCLDIVASLAFDGRESRRTWGTVLDVGCGAGRLSRLRLAEQYIGVDSSPVMVGRCIGNGLDAVGASIYRLPFGDNAYDLVVCHAVLFHLADILPAWKELWRVTKHRLVISCYWDSWLHKAQDRISWNQDKEAGKQWPALNKVLPRWMIRRIPRKALVPSPIETKFVFRKSVAGGNMRIAFARMDKLRKE